MFAKIFLLAWAADSRQLNTFELKMFCEFSKDKVLSSQYTSFICIFGPKNAFDVNDFCPNWSEPWTCIVPPYMMCMTCRFPLGGSSHTGIRKDPELSSISSPAWSIRDYTLSVCPRLLFYLDTTMISQNSSLEIFVINLLLIILPFILNRIKSWSYAPQFYHAMAASTIYRLQSSISYKDLKV